METHVAPEGAPSRQPAPAGEIDAALREALRCLEEEWHDDAIVACERALELDPRSAEALHLLGLITFDLDDPMRAIELLEGAHELNPGLREIADALAALNGRIGKINDGLFYAKLATTLEPHPTIEGLLPQRFGSFLPNLEAADPHLYRARARRKLASGDFAGAAGDCERQLELTPGDLPTLRLLAEAARQTGQPARAVAAYHSVLHGEIVQVEDLSGLAGALSLGGRHEEALACHRAVVERAPDRAELHARLLTGLMRWPGARSRDLAEAHLAWQARHAAGLAPRPLPADHDRDPGRPLRVGYLCGAFHRGDLMELFEPVLQAHDPNRIRTYCYADGGRLDTTTEGLMRAAGKWTDITGVDDETVWQILRGDALDIAVDLSGHLPGGRPLVLARRPAPLAVSWLGYPHPPGVAAIDYFVTDQSAWPDAAEGTATGEGLWWLNRPGIAFRPPALLPDVGPLPAAQAGHVTFGIATDLSLIDIAAAALWARVLLAVPNARLLICNRFDQDQAAVERCQEVFSHVGLRDRVDIVNMAENFASPFDFYRHVDLALDPPAGGAPAEACRALWMGVPLLALAGDRHATRLSASLLTAAGHPDWAVESPGDLASLACSLAADHGRLAALRSGLRDEVAGSQLGDVTGLARAAEEAYRGMWHQWCAASEEGGDETRI